MLISNQYKSLDLLPELKRLINTLSGNLGKTPYKLGTSNPGLFLKRLALIKKAVARVQKKNDDAAKKDAMKMMKQAGMFD